MAEEMATAASCIVIFSAFCSLALSFFTLLFPHPESVATIISTIAALITIFGQSAVRIKELIEQELGTDRVEVEFFPDGQLGKDTTILEGMALGSYDALIVGTPVTNVKNLLSIHTKDFPAHLLHLAASH